MKVKDESIRCEFHPILSDFIFRYVDKFYSTEVYEGKGEGVITSGSESSAKHGYTSLHYNIPGQAIDIRSWTVGKWDAEAQHKRLTEIAIQYCQVNNIPVDWIEVILETDHIHIELQPKRRDT